MRLTCWEVPLEGTKIRARVGLSSGGWGWGRFCACLSEPEMLTFAVVSVGEE